MTQPLHLTDCHEWDEAHEQEEEKSEEPDASGDQSEIDPRGSIEAPAGRQEIPMKRRHDDDETLEPHAGENGQAGGEEAPARSS